MRLIQQLAQTSIMLTLVSGTQTGSVLGRTLVETFSTTTYKDSAGTTADWNTTDGELRLHPFTPGIVGTYDTSGFSNAVFVAGNKAFLADGSFGLAVIDITDPTAPVLDSSIDTPGNAKGVFVSGEHTFVADGSSGLQVIGPTSGSYDTGDAEDVFVTGDLAFVADRDAGLVVIDISNPAVPSLAGGYAIAGRTSGVFVSGDHAYVTNQDSGFLVIDVSDPTTPALAASLSGMSAPQDVFVSGNLAFVADWTDGLRVIDVSDPTTPVQVGSVDPGVAATDVQVSGDRALLTASGGGVRVIDISNPAAPVVLSSVDTPGSALGLFVFGSRAYVADFASGLQVIDFAQPAPPVLAGSLGGIDFPLGVHVAGNHAYVADRSALRVVDVTDPTTPVLVGSFATLDDFYRGVAVEGDYAYLGSNTGLQVIDISDPTTLALAGSDAVTAEYLFISGNELYVVSGQDLIVFDITDPTTPSQIGGTSLDKDGDAQDVYVAGDHAFVTYRDNINGNSGLQVIDISDPTFPTPTLNDIELSASSCPNNQVHVSGDYAYVAGCEDGLYVIDISDPNNPAFAGNLDAGIAHDVFVDADRAYVVGFELQVIDISDPTSPILLDTYPASPGTSSRFGIFVAGAHAYMSTSDQDLFEVIQVTEDGLDVVRDTGLSLAVDGADETILLGRVTSTQTSTVTWELSADGGTSWLPVAPDGEWNALSPGTDLLWRSTHERTALGVNPSVSQLQIDWLVESPMVDAISDVGNDQGKQVSLEWIRSGYDFPGSASPITEYAVYRKIDPDLSKVQPVSSGNTRAWSEPLRAQVQTMAEAGWHFVTTVPARTEDEYAVVAPTLKDSTISEGQYHSVFFVSALTETPGVYFDSPPDSGYSVDNLDPFAPSNMTVTYGTGSGNQLDWDDPVDEDFQYFRIYRGTTPDFEISSGTLVDATTVTSWTDPENDGAGVYYKVTTVDFSGNESDPASADTATSVEEGRLPGRFSLRQNHPNPFNPTTTIRFEVPAPGGRVGLHVYDVAGRSVRTLVDGIVGPGVRSLTWDARDDDGTQVATGIYFYRLTAPGFTQIRKMTLLQ